MAPGGLRSCRPRPTLPLAEGGEGPACELANLVIAVEPFAPINLCLETQRGRQTTAEGPWQKQEGQGPTCQPSASWGRLGRDPTPHVTEKKTEAGGWGAGQGSGLKDPPPSSTTAQANPVPQSALCPSPGLEILMSLVWAGARLFFFFFFLYFFFFLNTPRSSSNAVSE